MKIFRLALWDFAGRVANYLLLFVTSIVLTRILDPADYGIFGIVLSVLAISSLFLDLGFKTAVIQAQEISQVQLSTVFFLNLALGLLVGGIFLGISSTLESFYELPGLGTYLQVASMSFLFTATLAVPSALLQRDLRFREQMLVSFGAALGASVVAISLAMSGYGVWSLIASQLMNTGVLAIGSFAVSKWWPSLAFRLSSIRDLWKFGSNLFASAILDTVYTRIDAFIVPKLFGVATFGYYTRAQSLEFMVRMSGISTIGSVIFPVFARNRNDEVLPSLFLRSVHFISFVAFAVSGAMVLLAQDIVVVLFTERWAESGNYLRVMAIPGFVFPLSALMVNLISARGNSKTFLLLEIIKKLLLTPAYFVFFFSGIYGFLVAIAIALVCCLIVNMAFAAKEIRVPFQHQLQAVAMYLFIALSAFLIAYGCLAITPHNSYVRLVVGIVTYQLSYLLFNYFLRTSALDELAEKLSLFVSDKRNTNISPTS